MLCQHCKKRQANTHIKRIINGDVKEYMLCETCAEEIGYTDMFSGFSLDFDSFLGNFFTESIPHKLQSKTSRCKSCGSSIEDISHSGKVGCADCYRVFYDKLLPSIKMIHKNVEHTGKIGACVDTAKRTMAEISKLQDNLENAIKNQEFEKAAEFRDKIRELRKECEAE